MKIREHSLDSLEEYLRMALQRADGHTEGPSRSGSERDLADEAAMEAYHKASPAEWDDAQRIFASGECIRAIVTGWNRGGLLVRWQQLQGFVPVSQLKEIPLFEDDATRDDELARWVGEELYLAPATSWSKKASPCGFVPMAACA